MLEVRELTIAQVQNGLRAGHFTAKELAATFLDRIERLDKSGPRLNSTMAISSTVLDEAATLDDYLKTHGQFKGKLHGIPVLVKDQVSTKSWLTFFQLICHRLTLPFPLAHSHRLIQKVLSRLTVRQPQFITSPRRMQLS